MRHPRGFYILSKLEDEFSDFGIDHDVGLPLAYLLSEKIALETPDAVRIINETFDMLLQLLEVEDTGFDELEDVFDARR